MIKKKPLIISALIGILALGLLISYIIYENISDSTNDEVVYDEGIDDDIVDKPAGVFANSGNPIITDVDEHYKIEVIPPSGYQIVDDYKSAYGTEFENEDKTICIEYVIDNYIPDEMQSYYEFDAQYYESSTENYSNVNTTEIKTMDVNGYQVNYLSLSYTNGDSENYVKYCAYVTLDDTTEFICNISGLADDVNEDMIKECFYAKLPVAK